MLTFKRLTPATPTLQQNEDGCLRLDIANSLEALAFALDRLDGFLGQKDASPRLAYVARLVLEELVANTIHYGYDDQDVHSIRLCFRIGPPATMTIEDDGHPFNPLAEAPEPDLDAAAEERAIGGLGIHMVRSMTASQDYQRQEGVNRIEIVFLPDDNYSGNPAQTSASGYSKRG